MRVSPQAFPILKVPQPPTIRGPSLPSQACLPSPRGGAGLLAPEIEQQEELREPRACRDGHGRRNVCLCKCACARQGGNRQGEDEDWQQTEQEGFCMRSRPRSKVSDAAAPTAAPWLLFLH